MRNISKSLIISIVALTISFCSFAQERNEQVTVEGSYRPQIKRSERLVKTPEVPKNEFNIPKYKAQTKDFDYGYDMEMETMSALQYKPVPNIETKGNLLKAAFGTRMSPVFSFNHYSDLSKKMTLRVGINHYSSWLDMKDYKKSSFMNNGINIMTTNKFKSGQLNIFGIYHYDMYHLRSYNDTQGNEVINNNGRNIHNGKVGAKWSSVGTSYRQLHQEYSGDYRYTGIMGGTSENQININANLAYSDSWIGIKSVDNLQTINVKMSASYDYVYKSLFLFDIKPSFTMNGNFYTLRLGFNIDFKTDEKVGIYPDLKGSFLLFNKKMELFAKLGGHSEINTFESIVKENPFVTTNFTYLSDFGYEKNLFDLNFGSKLNIFNILDFYISARYQTIKNGIFYIPDYDFYVRYDKDNKDYHLQAFDVTFIDYDVWKFIFDLSCKINEDANVSIALNFNNFSIDRPWYKPAFEMNVGGDYKFDEHWKFKVSMLAIGKRWALDENSNEIQLDPAFDIQFGADYQFANGLVAFAEIHNLIHNKYQLFYNYPSVGFELYLGLKYRF